MTSNESAAAAAAQDSGPSAAELLEVLRRLEVELHHPGAHLTSARLDQLLHPQFHEVGRSGSVYDGATVKAHLASQAEPPDVVSDCFKLAWLAPGAALLTYRSAHRSMDGCLSRHTLRSSIWLQTPEGWQLRYHQGTPAADRW